ncbi:GntR family transcriptional regulator [Opitutaceae bacterium TAV4]|nr:GntR family transcriptional regulator [Opitutaceae bacterium TAV4]RRK01822.1 GntR family transcriptional regulator [Opitutaceae bacterium TAV3]
MSVAAITPDTLSGLPPRQQVDMLVRTWLRTGEYRPGDLLPTASDIARLCNDISKPTVRRALKTLIDEGLLRGAQGKGVYVCNRRPKNKKARATGFPHT